MAKASVSKASTNWEGSLFKGTGQTKLETSGLAAFDVNWGKRAESGQGTTNPEELLAAALATCYSMALSNALSEEGHEPESIDTTAEMSFVPGEGVTGAKITVKGNVPGLSDDEFRSKAEWARDNCPVSAALSGVPKELEIL